MAMDCTGRGWTHLTLKIRNLNVKTSPLSQHEHAAFTPDGSPLPSITLIHMLRGQHLDTPDSLRQQ